MIRFDNFPEGANMDDIKWDYRPETREERFTDPARLDELRKIAESGIDADGWFLREVKWESDMASAVRGLHDEGLGRVPQPTRVIGLAVFERVLYRR